MARVQGGVVKPECIHQTPDGKQGCSHAKVELMMVNSLHVRKHRKSIKHSGSVETLGTFSQPKNSLQDEEEEDDDEPKVLDWMKEACR